MASMNIKNKKGYLFGLKVMGIYIYVSRQRMKTRGKSGLRSKGYDRRATERMRIEKYAKGKGLCEKCGKALSEDGMELHHVLPYSSFPEYRYRMDNVQLLCHDCHLTLHRNLYLRIIDMENKATAFGIDLRKWMNDHYGSLPPVSFSHS